MTPLDGLPGGAPVDGSDQMAESTLEPIAIVVGFGLGSMENEDPNVNGGKPVQVISLNLQIHVPMDEEMAKQIGNKLLAPSVQIHRSMPHG